MAEDLSKLYTDETQDNVEALKKAADEARAEYSSHPFTTKDVVLDILGFFVTVAIAFGWTLLMLLIVSFVALSYLHMHIEQMLLWSAIVSAIVAILYIVKKYRKYNRLLHHI